MSSEPESHGSTESSWSTRQLQVRHPITCNERNLTKLNCRLQIQTFNNISLPLPAEETDSTDDEDTMNWPVGYKLTSEDHELLEI